MNRITFNRSGSLLATGSDDKQILIWSHEHDHSLTNGRRPSMAPTACVRIATGHTRNIFGVQFLPSSNDHTIVSGAMDYQVRKHVLQATPSPSPASTTTTAATSTTAPPLPPAADCRTTTYRCHRSRVKEVEVDPVLSPDLFWSASEDGTIRQFDGREPHACVAGSHHHSCPNVFARIFGEFKGVAVSRARPYYVATACGDEKVRIYDRRMCSVRADTQVGTGCCYELQPYRYDAANDSRFFTTHVSFSRDGRTLLANYNGDHIYSFNLESEQTQVFQAPRAAASSVISPAGDDDDDDVNDVAASPSAAAVSSDVPSSSSSPPSLARSPPRESGVGNEEEEEAAAAEEEDIFTPGCTGDGCRFCLTAQRHREEGNQLFHRTDYAQAIAEYSAGLELCCTSNSGLYTTLLSNRAWAYLKRKWRGDGECALRDCDKALLANPTHMKAMFRRAYALYSLEEHGEALEAAKQCILIHENMATALGPLMRKLQNHSQSAASSGSDDQADAGELATSGQAPSERVNGSSCQRIFDWHQRYSGHLHTSTDIKEAFFFGDSDQYVMSGSDDGGLYIWRRSNGELLNILKADESVCNSFKAHPHLPLIATSGIENVIRIWMPFKAKPTKIDTPAIRSLIRSNQESLKRPDSFIDIPFLELLQMQMRGVLRQ